MHPGVNGTDAAEQLEFLVRHLLCHIVSQVAVRDKEDALVRQLPADIHRRGGGDAYIAKGFQLRCGVDVCHYGVIRIPFLDLPDQCLVHLLRHGTSRRSVGKQHLLFRGQDLYRFRHKPDAAQQHSGLGGACCFQA